MSTTAEPLKHEVCIIYVQSTGYLKAQYDRSDFELLDLDKNEVLDLENRIKYQFSNKGTYSVEISYEHFVQIFYINFIFFGYILERHLYKTLN